MSKSKNLTEKLLNEVYVNNQEIVKEVYAQRKTELLKQEDSMLNEESKLSKERKLKSDSDDSDSEGSCEGITVFDATYSFNNIDFLIGTNCDDVFYTQDNINITYTLEGNDVVFGGANTDLIAANYDGDKFIFDRGGNDFIATGSGNDYVRTAGEGSDHITTSSGDDVVEIEIKTNVENPGYKYIDTGADNDSVTLFSGFHSDAEVTTILGDGDDVVNVYGNGDINIDGGAGDDEINYIYSSEVVDADYQITADGGAGNDVFVFGNASTVNTLGEGDDVIDYTQYNEGSLFGTNVDVVTDFTFWEDKILLTEEGINRNPNILDIDFEGATADFEIMFQIMQMTEQLPFSNGQQQFLSENSDGNVVLNFDYNTSVANADLVLEGYSMNEFILQMYDGADIFDFV
jgi:Ca2+-binding RTX toxin-like protein